MGDTVPEIVVKNLYASEALLIPTNSRTINSPGQYFNTTFYGCGSPKIDQIHGGILLFKEIKSRMLEVRPLIYMEKLDRLYGWCVETID